MCGITAIFAYRPDAADVERAELVAIREAMRARGPDGEGAWIAADGRVGLAHRRLAIIDLSDDAAQPMDLANGRYRITYNGEIYNFRALREGLESQGRVFTTESDTEVLLHLYDALGADMVHELRGMFAFALWDEAKQGLFLARDPFGIKPLYYADDGKTIRVASQVKALLGGGHLDVGGGSVGGVEHERSATLAVLRKAAALDANRLGYDAPGMGTALLLAENVGAYRRQPLDEEPWDAALQILVLGRQIASTQLGEAECPISACVLRELEGSCRVGVRIARLGFGSERGQRSVHGHCNQQR